MNFLSKKTALQILFRAISVVFFMLLIQVSFAQQEQNDPDMPDFGKNKMDKEEFMKKRAEAIGQLRGVDETRPFNPALRIAAVDQMKQQKTQLLNRIGGGIANLGGSWSPIGPAPIPNGQVVSGAQLPVSGRVTAIAVHPTNPNTNPGKSLSTVSSKSLGSE